MDAYLLGLILGSILQPSTIVALLLAIFLKKRLLLWMKLITILRQDEQPQMDRKQVQGKFLMRYKQH